MSRAYLWLRELVIATDRFLQVLLSGPHYLLTGRSRPTSRETISSRVGRAKVAGRRWGILCAAIIDRIFIWLGEGPDHCERMIEI